MKEAKRFDVDLDILKAALEDNNPEQILSFVNKQHAADIAELFDELDIDEQNKVLSLMDNEHSAAVLLELEEDDRKKLLYTFTPKEIADEVITELDSDDAADVIAELSERRKKQVIGHIGDQEQARDIVDLLRYDEDSAGGLMRKEYIKVNQNWSVVTAIKQMRKQAEEMEEVYSVYVVDDTDKLLGTLSLKRLLTTSSSTLVKEVFRSKFHAVTVNDDAEVVAQDIQKYDLFEMPVIDDLGRLVGNITVDDVMDVMRDEAEKDYQMASGISEDVDMQDNLWSLTKARLPWLLIGVGGSLVSSQILDGNLQAMQQIPILILFIPLIAATAGNMGVQSSAIVVQAIAQGNMRTSMWQNLKKEFSMGLINGTALAIILLLFNYIFYGNILTALTISISLFAVVVVAAIIGTMIPLILHKRGIDPAIATGPFITTSNDVIGISLYFLMAKLLLGI